MPNMRKRFRNTSLAVFSAVCVTTILMSVYQSFIKLSPGITISVCSVVAIGVLALRLIQYHNKDKRKRLKKERKAMENQIQQEIGAQ